jgi:hypothetical protein
MWGVRLLARRCQRQKPLLLLLILLLLLMLLVLLLLLFTRFVCFCQGELFAEEIRGQVFVHVRDRKLVAWWCHYIIRCCLFLVNDMCRKLYLQIRVCPFM